MITKSFYYLLSKTYSIFFSYMELIFLNKNRSTKTKPIYHLNNVNLNKFNYYDFEKINKNKYLTKFIFPEEIIYKLIEDLFIKNKLQDRITALTGYEYSINFFTAYKTYKILKEDLAKPWYANQFHIDKPYSKNMLKLFFSFEIIGENDGPMAVKADKIYNVTLQKDEVALFLANQYFHRATSPKNGSRFQMMFQLNPSRKWEVNKKIFIKQRGLEPKFPFFSYIFDKKTKLNKLKL